jgi:hypothetical protein
MHYTSSNIGEREMTLEEFAKDAGVEVFECEPGWGGKYGYHETGSPWHLVNGLRSEAACYKDWLKEKFGEQTSKAIVKLLRRAK